MAESNSSSSCPGFDIRLNGDFSWNGSPRSNLCLGLWEINETPDCCFMAGLPKATLYFYHPSPHKSLLGGGEEAICISRPGQARFLLKCKWKFWKGNLVRMLGGREWVNTLKSPLPTLLSSFWNRLLYPGFYQSGRQQFLLSRLFFFLSFL